MVNIDHAVAATLLTMVGWLMKVIEEGIPDLEDVDVYQMAKELQGEALSGKKA